jgi:hypothetical protein
MSQSATRRLSVPLAVCARSTRAAAADADEASPADAEPRRVGYAGDGDKYEGHVAGVLYRIWLPKGWTPGGPLLMNMYGYWPTVMPYSPLSDEVKYDAIVSSWLALGYAVAVSQSQYGWVPQRRMEDTERLRQYFIGTFGQGAASYPSVISGFSMGGMQTYHVIETNAHYHGALALSGFAMPSLAYLQKHVFSTRLLFDFYFRAFSEAASSAFRTQRTR